MNCLSKQTAVNDRGEPVTFFTELLTYSYSISQSSKQWPVQLVVGRLNGTFSFAGPGFAGTQKVKEIESENNNSPTLNTHFFFLLPASTEHNNKR